MSTSCDFIKTLTSKQKEELRKLLNEDEQPQPKYRVEVEFYDKEKTKIRSLREYLDDKCHGINKGWYENGQLEYEWPYQSGKEHGICKRWYENGKLECEWLYQNGERYGICKGWHENGQLSYEKYWLHGKQVSKEEYINEL